MIKKGVPIGAVASVLSFFLFIMMLNGEAPPAFSQDVVIIGNTDVPQGSLSPNDIRQIFLGLKKSWDNGKSLSFVIMKDSETHTSFLRQYIQKNPSQFLAYWRLMLFSGKGQIPKSFATDEEIIEFVAANPGAVGYVSASGSSTKVKIISVSAN